MYTYAKYFNVHVMLFNVSAENWIGLFLQYHKSWLRQL